MENKDYARYIVYLLAVIVVTAAISYAIFNVNFEGTQDIKIDTNTLSFNYNETTSNITLENPEALSDAEGITKGGSFNFNISATSSKAQTINYAIYLTEETGNTLDKSLVKLALLDGSSNTLVSATAFKNLQSFPKKTGTTLLYQDSVNLSKNVESRKNYSLKYWLSENANEITKTTEDKKQIATLKGGTFKFRVNVMVI